MATLNSPTDLSGSLKLNLAAIDLEALRRQLGGDVGGGHRAEQMALFAGLAGEAQRDRRELGDQFLSLNLFSGRAAGRSGLHLLNDSLVGLGGLQRQLARQQIIAAVAFRDLHHVSAVAKIGYVFLQNYFHRNSPIARALRG